MKPGKFDIEVPYGGTINIPITASDDNGPLDFGAVYSGARLFCHHASTNEAKDIIGSPIYEFTTDNSRISIDGETLSILLSAAECKAIPFRSARYWLELYVTGSPEVVDPFLYGEFKIDMGEW